jgi:tetratricopeptide (TPR) repeat protein
MNNNQPSQTDSYREFMLNHPQKAKRITHHLNKGRYLMEIGSINEARRQFLQALNIYHHATPALNNLALIALDEDDPNRAIEIAQKVIDHDKDDPIAYAIMSRCWLSMESLPMAHSYANQSMIHLIDLIDQGDQVDPEYPDFCLQILLGVLVLLEDDMMIMSLHSNLEDYSWDPYELTWIGIAYFNRGFMQDAYDCWLIAEDQDFLPASTYISLLDNLKQQTLSPFRLDYNLNIFDEGYDSRTPFFSLIIAHLIDMVFNSQGTEAQNALSCLAESNMPGMFNFLNKVFMTESLSMGLRITAALHMFWEGVLDYDELNDFYIEIPEQELAREDLPAYYLLEVIIHEEGDDPRSISTQHELASLGLLAAEAFKNCWAIEYLKEYLNYQEESDKKPSSNSPSGDKLIQLKSVTERNLSKNPSKKRK